MEKHKVGYVVFKWILGPIFYLYYRPKFVNKKVIPKDGPIIVCGNHIHLYDQCLPILCTRRMLHYMAKKEYFDNKKVAWFFKASGCICVDRKHHGGDSKEKALEVLKNGYALGIYPEGTRNKTKDPLLPFKFGTVALAQKTNATIVPYGITGKYKFWHNKLKIEFGTPFKVDKMTLEEANDKLYNEILNLITNKTSK